MIKLVNAMTWIVVVVALLAAPTAGVAQSEEAAPVAARVPLIKVRFGVHRDFERMVFDWTELVPYRIEARGRDVVLSFDRPGRINEEAIRRGLSRIATDVQIGAEEQGLRVTLTLAESIRVRHHFRDGTFIAFDFQNVTRSATADGSTLAEDSAVLAAAQPADPRERRRATRAAVRSGAAPDDPAPAQAPAPAAAPAPAPAPATTAEKPNQGAEPVNVLRPRGAMPAVADAAPADPRPREAAKPSPLLVPAAAAVTTPMVSTERPLPVDLVSTADGLSLRFGWQEPVAAAVFSSGDHLWIVFDRPARVDLPQLKLRLRDKVGGVELIDSAGLTLRVAPQGGANAIARREGLEWFVELHPSRQRPVHVAAVVGRSDGEAEPASQTRPRAESRLVIDLPATGPVFRLIDPDLGEPLYAATSGVPGHGVTGPRDFVTFRLLESAQGVAIAPRADGLSIRGLGHGVEIARAGSLWVTPQTEPPPVLQAKLSESKSPRLFDFARWHRGGPANFAADRQALVEAITKAPDNARGKARLDLARFFFAHGQVAEAHGLIQLVEQQDPNLIGTPSLKALRGIAQYLMGDVDEARRTLDHPSLQAEPEAALWRAGLAFAAGEAERALAAFGRGAHLLESYPPIYANRLALAMVDALLETEQHDRAREMLDWIAGNQPTAWQRGELDFRRGRLIARSDSQTATALWSELADGRHNSARVKAMIAKTELQLAKGEIKPAEAAANYDRLRYAWRGDELEFTVLRRLGALQLAAGDARAGLVTLRQAATYFPEHKDTKAVVEEMKTAFAKLYLDGGAEKLPPAQAIGLFEEFRELSPGGARGDQVIRALADRMISVELLDRAADLLDQLVKSRLAGVERAEAGTRLAFVRLLDRRPEAAIEALRASESESAPAAMRLERVRLEARALAELGRIDDAMARLDGDGARDADVLRLEILARAGKWPQVAPVLERLAGDAPAPGKAPSEEQAKLAINWAVALVLAGEEAGLRRLSERFGPTLDAGPYRDIYRMLTATPGGTPADMAAIVQRLGSVAPYQSFLDVYRGRLGAKAEAGASKGG